MLVAINTASYNQFPFNLSVRHREKYVYINNDDGDDGDYDDEQTNFKVFGKYSEENGIILQLFSYHIFAEYLKIYLNSTNQSTKKKNWFKNIK